MASNSILFCLQGESGFDDNSDVIR